ncbi:MAG: APC family permease [Thermoleophilaceae bacterium]
MPQASRLVRRLGLADAVVVGLGAMLGAGVFTALAPAARSAGTGLLLGLALAGLVAHLNARSSARLAALYPESGGTYAYGRRRLGPFWGYLAGWSFVVGKLASAAAIALAFGTYLAPGAARPLAIGAVLVLTLVNLLGIERTVALTALIVTLVLAALAVFVVAVLIGGGADLSRLGSPFEHSPWDVIRSAGLLFFAFAGYARIATLGEEVRDPERTIPLAISVALALVIVVYALVAVAALAAIGPSGVAAANAPLRAALSGSAARGIVGAGAAIASAGVLLSLLAGLSRTAFAMAAQGDLPRVLAAVGRRNVPHRAELAGAVVVVAAASLLDLRGAIGFSSFGVLTYYAIANASAFTLSRSGRVGATLGLVGCLTLALALPGDSVLAGASVLAAGGVAWRARRMMR